MAVDDGQADEADAADHLRRNARRIGAAVAKEEGISDGKIGEGVFGKSITDPCLGWEKTEALIYSIAEQL